MGAYTDKEPDRQSADLLMSVHETQRASSQVTSPPASTPSAINTSTGEVTDTAAVATWAGCLAIPEDGDARGQARLIKSVSAGASYIVDTPWPSVTGTTRIRIWSPAAVPVVASTAGNVGGTTTVDATRHASVSTEPNDYPNVGGFLLVCYGGTNTGKAVRVTDFVSSSGTYTNDAWGAQSASGDVHLLAKMLRPEGDAITASVEPHYIQRRATGYTAPDVAVMGVTSGSISFELALRPLQTIGTAGTPTVEPMEMGDLLADVFTQTNDSGGTVSSTLNETVTLSGGQGANFTVGGFALLASGEMCHIRSISTDTLTLGTNHMDTASLVIAASVVNGACWWKKKQTGLRTRTFYYWKGGRFFQMFEGCSPTLSINISRDAVVRFAWAYTAGAAFQWRFPRPVAVGASKPIKALDTTVPRAPHGARYLLNGVPVVMTDTTIDFAFGPSVRGSVTGVNGSDGTFNNVAGMTKITTGIFAREDSIASFDDLVDRLNNRRQMDFLIQVGSEAGFSFAFCAPAVQLVKATHEYKEGEGYYGCELQCTQPQLVPGNTFDDALPPESFGIA